MVLQKKAHKAPPERVSLDTRGEGWPVIRRDLNGDAFAEAAAALEHAPDGLVRVTIDDEIAAEPAHSLSSGSPRRLRPGCWPQSSRGLASPSVAGC